MRLRRHRSFNDRRCVVCRDRREVKPKAIVDRHYDAARTVEVFSTPRLHEVDLDTLSAELLAVVDQTMQPTMDRARAMRCGSDGGERERDREPGDHQWSGQHALDRVGFGQQGVRQHR